jgi:hypothetical protein
VKRLAELIIFVVCAVWLSACTGQGVYSTKLVLDGELVIREGTVESSDIILFDGQVIVEPGAEVMGDVVQLLGTLNIEGQVRGDVHQLSGDLIFGDQGRILGNLNLIGAPQQDGFDLPVGGEIIQRAPEVPFTRQWLYQTTERRLTWDLTETALLTLLAMLVGRSAPRFAGNITASLGEYPLVSGAMGILVLVVGLALVVQMIFTLLLIPLSILGVLLFLVSIGLGWTGFGGLIGKWISKRLEVEWPAWLVSGMGTLLFGSTLNFLEWLPGPWSALSFITAIMGLGAVFLTRFGHRRFVAASLDQGLDA